MIASRPNSEQPLFKQAGSVIFTEGEMPKFLYLLKRGEVRLLRFQGQHLHAFEICKPGDILNELSVLSKKPEQFSAISKTDVELVLVEQKDILSAINQGPSWIPDIFKTLCERLELTQELIAAHNLASGDKDESLILSKDDEIKYLKALTDFKSK